MRVEKDSIGERELPDDVYYGIHTLRSLENFGRQNSFPYEIIRSIIAIKIACAKANKRLGLLSKEKTDAIEQACRLLLDGKHEDQLILSTFQSGSGTSTNMNVNEVIANLAAEIMGRKKGEKILHPNDDVNMGQSTNNIVPSGIKVCIVDISDTLLKNINDLALLLRKKETEFSKILTTGRTHLQDAVPITMGQRFGAYATAIEKDIVRIEGSVQKILELGIGGNAVGTGINTKKEFKSLITKELNQITGKEFKIAKDGLEATQFHTDLAQFSSALKLFSIDILKISNDLRLLSSGPNTGLGEIALPALEPGSSIMPGKINPSMCEAVNMACIQVQANDHAVSTACNLSQLELNTHVPLIGKSIIDSLNLLNSIIPSFTGKCIKDIQVNESVCIENFEKSAGLAAILNPILGYDMVAEIVKESLETGKTLKQLILEKKLIDEKEFNKILSSSTGPQ